MKISRSGIILVISALAVMFFLSAIIRLGSKYFLDEHPRKLADATISEVRAHGKQWLKSNLKDPRSLEIIEWGVLEKTDIGFSIWVQYRAKNSFGGYVVESVELFTDRFGYVLYTK